MSFWAESPATLFTSNNWTQFVPLPSMPVPEALNAVVRFAVYFSTLLFVATHDPNYLYLIVAVLILTYVLYKLFPHGKTLESFVAGRESFTQPTPNNPFMNVLLTDITDNPNRGDAEPITSPVVRAKIAKAFQHTNDLYMDTSDLFDQTQAMRTFSTIQSAKVPNDQDSFLGFLAKGYGEPDYSSAPLARGGKAGSEGYLPARGGMTLPSSISAPRGTTPAT